MKAFASSVLCLLAFVSPSTQVCAPDCSNVDPGTSVKDPTDCTRYYVCIDASGDGTLVPSAEAVSCPDDQYFNDQHTSPRCDPISGAPQGFCSSLCNPCVPHCTHPGEVTPHPTDCSSYFVCLEGGHVMEVGCPSNLPYFDFLVGDCQADETLCYPYCDECEPHCTHDGERIADPTNCHRFYLCSPPTMSVFLCPHDQVFNADTGVCEDDAICYEDCDGGVTQRVF